MKNIGLIQASDEVKRDICEIRDKLLAYTGISVDILEVNDSTIKVRVEQKELKNNFILNQRELVGRAATVLAPLENKFKIQFIVLTYQPSFNELDAGWINDKLSSFKLSRNDLIKQMGIDKSTLSVLLSGEKQLTRFQRAAFYYYFMTYELNRDFREHLNE